MNMIWGSSLPLQPALTGGVVRLWTSSTPLRRRPLGSFQRLEQRGRRCEWRWQHRGGGSEPAVEQLERVQQRTDSLPSIQSSCCRSNSLGRVLTCGRAPRRSPPPLAPQPALAPHPPPAPQTPSDRKPSSHRRARRASWGDRARRLRAATIRAGS